MISFFGLIPTSPLTRVCTSADGAAFEALQEGAAHITFRQFFHANGDLFQRAINFTFPELQEVCAVFAAVLRQWLRGAVLMSGL